MHNLLVMSVSFALFYLYLPAQGLQAENSNLLKPGAITSLLILYKVNVQCALSLFK